MIRPVNEKDIRLQLSGNPTYLGTITCTSTAANNYTTTTPFKYNTGDTLSGAVLLLRADNSCRLLPGTVNTVAASTTRGSTYGFKLGSDENFTVIMSQLNGFLSAVSIGGGTVNLDVWSLT